MIWLSIQIGTPLTHIYCQCNETKSDRFDSFSQPITASMQCIFFSMPFRERSAWSTVTTVIGSIKQSICQSLAAINDAKLQLTAAKLHSGIYHFSGSICIRIFTSFEPNVIALCMLSVHCCSCLWIEMMNVNAIEQQSKPLVKCGTKWARSSVFPGRPQQKFIQFYFYPNRALWKPFVCLVKETH